MAANPGRRCDAQRGSPLATRLLATRCFVAIRASSPRLIAVEAIPWVLDPFANFMLYERTSIRWWVSVDAHTLNGHRMSYIAARLSPLTRILPALS
jgi:hypothetical protein